MSETAPESAEAGSKRGYEPPRGAVTEHELTIRGRRLAYKTHADWLVLRKDEEPSAELFHAAYLLDGETPEQRPITFVFNGGPGASSAYLHVGALGPRRVAFGERGAVVPPPVRLLDNEDSWLPFSDLVFVDPVGTGFSRIVERPGGGLPDGDGKRAQGGTDAKKAFYGLNRDLDTLGEFIQRFLSRHHRWASPVFIAGESYGGFRVGKLCRRLQEGFGVGLNGAVLISPCLEWAVLTPSDYDVLHFVDVFPAMAATAHYHGRCRALAPELPLADVLAAAEAFAANELTSLLVSGERLGSARRNDLAARAAALLGMPGELMRKTGGRLHVEQFVRELLRDEGRICGMYDGTATGYDPYPGRDTGQGPDPTLFTIERVFASGINAELRSALGVETERDYRLLSLDVHKAWSLDTEQHVFERHVGATDDVRYAMSLNPHMKVLITHGFYDLVTPYFATERLVGHLQLAEALRANLTTRHFAGGHMFYTWERSRGEFRDLVASFVGAAC